MEINPKFRLKRITSFSYGEKEPGFLFPGESHEAFELIYVNTGCLHSVVDGRDMPLYARNIIVYGSNQFHMQYAEAEDAPVFLSVTFEAEGLNLSPLLGIVHYPTEMIDTVISLMLDEHRHADIYTGDMLLSLLSQLLLLLCRNRNRNRSPIPILGENEIIRRAQQDICGHIREKLTVPVVAGRVDVSPSYLTALFQKHLQISPGEYIRRAKLQESKRMIQETDLNFTQIAAALQYSTVHHFSRQFKEKFGMTPSEYAKSVR